MLHQVDLPAPVPRPLEVLEKVSAASVNPIDSKLRSGKFALLSRWVLPKIVGNDFSGTVVAVGSGVRSVRVGDEVFGAISPISSRGTCAEYVAVRESKLLQKPALLSHVEAAALPVAGAAALAALRGMSQGDAVLLIGASGGVGTLAVQMAKQGGLTVTAVASPRRHADLRALGTDEVASYDGNGFLALRRKFDRVVDLSASYSVRQVAPLMKPGALFVAASPGPGTLSNLLYAVTHGFRATTMAAASGRDILRQICEAVGKGVRPLIGGTYPLEAVAEAHAQIATGHTQGKIVVLIDP